MGGHGAAGQQEALSSPFSAPMEEMDGWRQNARPIVVGRPGAPERDLGKSLGLSVKLFMQPAQLEFDNNDCSQRPAFGTWDAHNDI